MGAVTKQGQTAEERLQRLLGIQTLLAKVAREIGADAVMVVSACSGHGFKHSPAIGEAVAQRLTGDASEIDLGAFGFERVERAY